MKKINYLIFAILICFCTQLEAGVLQDSTNVTGLLTGNGSKKWKLISQTVFPEDSLCAAPNPMTEDNIYTYSTNGSFHFNQGTVATYNYCKDPSNHGGNWTLTENNTKIIFNYTYSGTSYYENSIPVEGSIVNISPSELKIRFDIDGQQFMLHFSPVQE